MSESIVKVKAGATIEWHARWMKNRTPVDLTGYTVKSQIRDTAGNLILELTVEKEDQAVYPGGYVLKATSLQTSTIRTGVCDIDVVYTNIDSGAAEPIETFLVEFVKRITRVE